MKSYTDIEQSKKLAKILSLESADMEYLAIKETGELIGDVPFVKDDSEVEDSAYSYTYDKIACWSLASLLGVLPSCLIYTPNAALNGYTCKNKIPDLVTYEDNPVDACYEMILKLHKLNLL